MNKEKLKTLEKYLNELKNRMTQPVVGKHEGHPETLKAYLQNEIRMTSLKIEALKGV